MSEGNIHASPESVESPKQDGCKVASPRHIIIKMPKVKDKERILKAAREKLVTYRRVPKRLSGDFPKETLQARRVWQEIFNHEKQGSAANIALLSKDIN